MPYDEQHRPEGRTVAAPPRAPPPPLVRPRSRRRRGLLLVALIGLAVVGGGAWYWNSIKNLESTDDAFTDGRAILIAAQVSGQVTELAVNDNAHVKPGQVLVRLDPRPFLAARDQARGQLEAAEGQLAAAQASLDLARVIYPARLASAEAQRTAAAAMLVRATADLHRQQSLPRVATTQQEIDQATAAERQATAQVGQADAAVREATAVQPNIAHAEAQVTQWQGQVAEAQAQLATAELNLGYATVTAPQEGWVTKRNVEVGDYVAAGAAIMSLVSPEVWITANFKETQLARMRPGQSVRISVDAFPGLALRGHVDSIQLGTGSRFTAFPPENATGNFVKIVQRVPVKIDIDSGLDPNLPLPLGLSVEPTVELR